MNLQLAVEDFLRGGGTKEEVSKRHGVSRGALYRALKKRHPTDDPEAGAIGIRGDIDFKTGKGWLQATEYQMPSEREVLEKYGLDPDVWRITRVQPNQWQGFYKKGLKGDEEHEIVTLHQLKIWIERAVPEPIEAAVEILASRLPSLPKIRSPKNIDKRVGQLAVFGLYDLHIGSLCWGAEVGQDYDSKIAEQVARNAIDDIRADLSMYPVSRIIVPVGNDLMHFDNPRGETSSGKVIVDQDTRYAKVVTTCHDVLAYMVDSFLPVIPEIDVIHVPGNHDAVTSLHMAHWIKQRYANNKRVRVNTEPSTRKYVYWEGTLLGFTHGDKIKPESHYRIMAEECREQWSSAKCREWHTGDKHHQVQINLKALDSVGKVTFRINPSLASKDSWTHSHGYDSMQCVDAWRYEPNKGLVGQHTAYARRD